MLYAMLLFWPDKTCYIVLSYHGFYRNPWYTRVPAPWGIHSIFRSTARPAPEPKFIIWSNHPQIYLSDSTSPTSPFFLSPTPSSLILPSSRFLRYTHTIASPSPHHPFLQSLISQYLPIPPSTISHSTTSLISSFNSLYFVYFLPASLPSHDINPNPRFIFGP